MCVCVCVRERERESALTSPLKFTNFRDVLLEDNRIGECHSFCFTLISKNNNISTFV